MLLQGECLARAPNMWQNTSRIAQPEMILVCATSVRCSNSIVLLYEALFFTCHLHCKGIGMTSWKTWRKGGSVQVHNSNFTCPNELLRQLYPEITIEAAVSNDFRCERIEQKQNGERKVEEKIKIVVLVPKSDLGKKKCGVVCSAPQTSFHPPLGYYSHPQSSKPATLGCVPVIDKL
jgi:uncharacterized ferredoxin-like protein